MSIPPPVRGRGPSPYLACAVVALLALASSGCFNPFSPRVGDKFGLASPPPTPSTPQGIIRLFEWCWNNKAVAEYKEVFTDDFRFQFGNGDSAVSQIHQDYFTREDEIIIAQNAFVSGSALKPPAIRVELSLDPTLLPLDDDRPGHLPRWHQVINSQVRLVIVTEDEELNVQGPVKFYVVRGDSAVIPDELKARFGPDSTRWWIDRWEDYTLGAAGTRAVRDPGSLRSLTPAQALDLVMSSRGAGTAAGGRAAMPTASRMNVTLGRVMVLWYDGPLLRTTPSGSVRAARR